MSNINTNEVEAVSKLAEITASIRAIAETATEADNKVYSSIVSNAMNGKVGVEVVVISPPVAAKLFLETNKKNRDWRYARSESIARQMRNGEWKLNGQGLQFYKNGDLADGQHRTSACALSGVSLPITIFYGLEPEAIVTIDGGTRRTASDAMSLDGVENSRELEQLVKAANAYELKTKVPGVLKLESVSEIYDEMRRSSERINRAIIIGQVSVKGISNPILNAKEAAKVAYIMIKNGWDETYVAQMLAFFQAGQDENESSPMFRAASAITKAKDARNNDDKMVANSLVGIIIKAFQLTEAGVKAIQPSKLSDIKKGTNLPSPVHGS